MPAPSPPSNAFGTGRPAARGRRLSWGAGGAPNGLSRDLRPDESLVPTFTSPPLEEPLDVVGFPAAILAWESSAPIATAVVRLSDVAPDGTSAQVTAGILNLTHRESHASPSPLEPGEVTTVTDPDAIDRLPIPAGPSDPAVGGVVVLAGHLAVAVQR